MPVEKQVVPDDFNDADNDKSLKSKSSSKCSYILSFLVFLLTHSTAKDLSHVPCKFFKVGACTAGSSCPFSHHEPGHQKDVCAWFIKGNCKFGHKCALAHILPGQSMSMDRKNKKAAQLATNGGVSSAAFREPKASRGGKKDAPSPLPHTISSSSNPGNSRTGLLSGSTAPTRTTSARPPMEMTLKATPSAPAPPVKDTDFPPFVLPDDDDHRPINALPTSTNTDPSAVNQETEDDEQEIPFSEPPPKSPALARHPSPPTLPLNVPSAPRRQVLITDAADLGPIGSPPRGSLSTHSPISSGNSPQNAGIPSTFHAQTSLLTESRNRLVGGLGVPSSLGHTHIPIWKADVGSVPTPTITSTANPGINVSVSGDKDILVADEDLEELLPSSLTDLLTPSERSRRMSRAHSGSSRPVNLNDTPSPLPGAPTQTQSHHANHRYSRSVPAPSLLGDVKSIWAERGLTTNGVPASPDKHNFGVSPIGSGTPSSLKSPSNGLGALNLGSTVTPSGTSVFRDDSHSPSSSLLAPSNASAAFLPSLHHYYSKMNVGGGNGRAPNAGLALGAGLGLGGLSRSPLSHAPIHAPAADEGRTGTNNGATIGLGLGEATSPSIRALQSHAPGQSLPQGLAAGCSRIHAIPLTGSPGSLGGSSIGGGAFSPGHGPMPFGINAWSGQDWHLQSNQVQHATEASLLSLSAHLDPATTSQAVPSSMVALESMFSRLPTGAPLRTPSHTMNVNRNWHAQNALSPLSRPISDDDELFSMDH